MSATKRKPLTEEQQAKRRAQYAADPERFKNYSLKWKSQHPTYRRDYMREYNKTHPNLNVHRTPKIGTAQNIAVTKTKLGLLCELCPEDNVLLAEERHHPDYDYPLFFVSVCRGCHKYAGASQVELSTNKNDLTNPNSLGVSSNNIKVVSKGGE
jgi:hypothetical protein